MTANSVALRFDNNGVAEMADYAQEATRVLKSIANEYRLMIVCRLAAGELSVGELNEYVPLSQSALSQHLSKLREDGIVETRREAQTIYYRLANDPVVRVISVLHEVYCGGPRSRPAGNRKRGDKR